MACDEGSKNGHSYNSSPDPFHCSTKMKEKKKKISSSSLDLISKATAFRKVSPGKMSERDPSGGEGNYRLTHDLQQQQEPPTIVAALLHCLEPALVGEVCCATRHWLQSAAAAIALPVALPKPAGPAQRRLVQANGEEQADGGVCTRGCGDAGVSGAFRGRVCGVDECRRQAGGRAGAHACRGRRRRSGGRFGSSTHQR